MGPIALTAQDLMAHEVARDPNQFRAPVVSVPSGRSSLDPELVALLGGIADAGSTYSFLKRGTGSEGNPIYKGLGNNPLATASSVFGSSLALKGLRSLMRRGGSKWDAVADILAATEGNARLGVAANNLRLVPRSNDAEQAYQDQINSGISRARTPFSTIR